MPGEGISKASLNATPEALFQSHCGFSILMEVLLIFLHTFLMCAFGADQSRSAAHMCTTAFQTWIHLDTKNAVHMKVYALAHGFYS